MLACKASLVAARDSCQRPSEAVTATASNASSVIDHRQRHRARLLRQHHRHRAVLTLRRMAVAQGVVNQVAQHALDRSGGMRFAPLGSLLFVPLQCHHLEGVACRVHRLEPLYLPRFDWVNAIGLLEPCRITGAPRRHHAHGRVTPKG